ncbi:lactate utilization protein [Millionella massiliensis]|uniref:lactate utilization protein n=1 Tax=Millionella massiliensis TaxID=1871023 RepID=UPI0008DAF3E5|nr:lactate utilization protein [Millionella massiliensis]
MADHTFEYWQRRLDDLARILEKHGFTAEVASTATDVRNRIRRAVETLAPKSVGYADSRTLRATGALDMLRADPRWEFIDGFDRAKSRAENLEMRRQALMTDLFLTGVNAVTEQGTLVWLDMVGNRIGGVTFGPRHVILVVGRNKLTADLDEAMRRIKTIAAPLNARAHVHFKTPCQITSRCHDCASPDRICNSWLMMERCYPKERIRVILVNDDMGY